jgi:uncharacterized protein
MPEYLSPGVYIEETSYRGKPIEGVSTSTAGFVGRARSGPEGTAVLVTNFNQFRRTFGEPYSNPSELGDYLGHAVRAFFENGGKRCYVVRALASDAVYAQSTLFEGTALRLPATATVRGPTDVIPLTSLRNVEAGTNLQIYTRPHAAAPFTHVTTVQVGSYDATRNTVKLTMALGLGVTYEPGNTFFQIASAPIPGAASGPVFRARHRGAAGNGIAVEVRPKDLPPVKLSTRAAIRSRPVIDNLSTPLASGAFEATLSAAAVRRLRTGDTIAFDGEEVLVTNIGSGSVTFDAVTGSNTYAAGTRVYLLQRGASAAPVRIPLGQLAGNVDLTGGPGTFALPHGIAAWLQNDDIVEFDDTVHQSQATVDGAPVLTSGPITFATLTQNHAAAKVTLVATSDSDPDTVRLVAGDVLGFQSPYRETSFEAVAVTDGTGHEDANILLVDLATSTLLLERTIVPSAFTATSWIRVESLQVGASGSTTLSVASTASFYSGALVELDPGPTVASKEYHLVDSVDAAARTVTLASPLTLGGPGNYLDVAVEPGARRAYLRTLELDIVVLQNGVVQETFAGLSWNPDTGAKSFGRYYANRINDADLGSKLVSVTPPAGPGSIEPDSQPTTASGFALFMDGGDDGSALTNVALIGADNGPGKRTGIEALKEREDISIVAVPGVHDEAVQQALITHCENLRYRMAVLDGRPGQSDVSAIQSHRGNYDSKYAAYYAPWLYTVDLATGQRLLVPPSGYVIGIYARSDNERGVHKAPANEVVRSILDVELPFTTGEQDVLNPVGVNLIRELSGRGIRVWGARTISSDPEWKYVNVRRLFIFLEHSIDRSTQWVVFEPNNEALWARLVDTITAFLVGVWKTGALMGTTPEEAFFVRCDRSTMTQDDIDNGRLVCEIGIAPTMPAEFVVFRIGQFTASTPGA